MRTLQGNEEKILKDLNPQQKEAVQTLKGPLLILAGAGSGKTRVLTHRTVYLILKDLSPPENILAITFTNKAANEMKSRVMSLLQNLNLTSSLKPNTPLWISTFHSFCVRILRRHIHHLNIPHSFTIYDQGDQLSLIKKIIKALNLNEKIHIPKSIASRINKAKTMALRPKDVSRKAPELLCDKFISIYETYEREKNKSIALDFGDLLFKTHELFLYKPEILAFYQDYFKYVMIDEYQDTNLIQYMIAQSIAIKHQNFCATGDEDQSIYSWRGANVKNILSFKKDFPESKIVKLEENYRSTQTIVSASHHLIRNNELRQEKTLFTQNAKGNKILLRELENETKEALFVAQKIKSLLNENTSFGYEDFAIFYRTNAQSRILEDMMRRLKLPYKIVGGFKFYDRMEIKDMLSYMKVISNPRDDLALKRILNTPARGLGKGALESIQDLAFEKNVSFYEALKIGIQEKVFSNRILKKLNIFYELIQNFIEQSKHLTLLELYFFILEHTSYKLNLQRENSLESKERLQNLEELAYVIKQFQIENPTDTENQAHLTSFLEKMTLISSEEREKENLSSISLMTLHVAKGLEFLNVFITGLEEGLLPSIRSWDSVREEELEEERRLLYVGMTRAKKNLIFSFARERQRWGRDEPRSPSPFLDEIPEEFLERENDFSFSSNDNLNLASDSSSSLEYDSDSSFPPHSKNSFYQGMKVHHPAFGIGSISKVEGSGKKKKSEHSF